MTHVLSISRRWLLLLAGFCLFSPGCASNGKTEQTAKIGMHVDAVLEFVVEYPLSWDKELRTAYGSSEGEVRWKQAEQPDALLQIKSTLKKGTGTTVDEEIEQLQQEYGGLEVQVKEQVDLPAGEAWHVTGRTDHLALEAYLLSSTNRRYQIILTSAPDNSAHYEEVMERITDSFRFLQ